MEICSENFPQHALLDMFPRLGNIAREAGTRTKFVCAGQHLKELVVITSKEWRLLLRQQVASQSREQYMAAKSGRV